MTKSPLKSPGVVTSSLIASIMEAGARLAEGGGSLPGRGRMVDSPWLTREDLSPGDYKGSGQPCPETL